MKRKKRGETLILVIILFMFVVSVSTAMLSVVTANYKARVTESKRIENLYASDSGIDVAYNIIGKTFNAAAVYANVKVNQLKNTKSSGNDTSIYNTDYENINSDITQLKNRIEYIRNCNSNHQLNDPKSPSEIEHEIAQKEALIKEDENLKEVLCNEEFKRAFKNFIKKHEYKSNETKYDIDEDGEQQDRLGTDENAPDKLKYSIEHNEYISDVTAIDNYLVQKVVFNILNKDNQTPKLDATVDERSSTSSYSSQGISKSDDDKGHYYDVSFTVYGEQYYDITVTSTFYTETENSSGNQLNERKLKANYKMIVPNYKDIYFQNYSGQLNEYLATKDRALTIYGDMNVNEINGLTVNGEIFVNGSDNTQAIAEDRVNGKYYGGITIKNSGNVLFDGNVITRGTFNISNPTIADAGTLPPKAITIKKNNTKDNKLYARNAYIGKAGSNSTSSLANVPCTLSVPDMVLDNDLTLNAENSQIDINNFYGINDNNDPSKKAKSSSSIIVNGNKGSKINITTSAYMMGTAHIATERDYQTAESGAVKGNYVAYSVKLNDAENIIYDKPLQVLDADQAAKEKHFIDYWADKNPDSGGITWPVDKNKIWSSGVLIYETAQGTDKKCEVVPSHFKEDLEHPGGDIYNKREEFAQYAYKFGQSANISDYDGSSMMGLTSFVKIDNIPSEYHLSDQNSKGEYAIFNNSKYTENGEYKEIQIIKSNDSQDSIDVDSDPKVIKIKVGSDGDGKYILNAVITTGGKVSIAEGITIKGCIIAEGDLNINGSNVEIDYAPDVIERVQAQNRETFKAVFGEGILSSQDASGSSGNTGGTQDLSYNLKNFLEDGTWRIIK